MARLHVVEVLLDAGADPFATQGDCYSLLDCAARFGRVDVLDLLKRKFDLSTPFGSYKEAALHTTTMHGQADAVHKLLDNGVEINVKSAAGETRTPVSNSGPVGLWGFN